MEIFKDIDYPVTLVDPMCGSGTLLTEAVTFHVPMHLRSFAFETAPFYRGKILKASAAHTPLPITEARGFDLNHELIQKVQSELSKQWPINFQVMDSLTTEIKVPEKLFMISNPPYGERLKIAGKRGSFLKNALQIYLTRDKPQRIAWVVPSDMDELFQQLPDYRTITSIHFKNGGLPVTLWVWEKL
jgi:putative N6-adenine-specific DNA methylase